MIRSKNEPEEEGTTVKRSEPPMGGFSESNERRVQPRQAEVQAERSEIDEEQMLLDYLIELGFVLEEAQKLVDMHEHLCDNAEMRQRMAEDYRMHFARWLYEQGEIQEEAP